MQDNQPPARGTGDDTMLWFAVLWVTILASAVFQSLPGIDLAVSRLAYVPDLGFPAAKYPPAAMLRSIGLAAGRVAPALLAIVLILKIFAPRTVAWFPGRPFLFLATSFALGPGLIVNLFLKDYWHRPRPVQSIPFGGTMDFMPAWVPGGACGINCSFVSGEASTSCWMIALALIAPPAWRRAALAAALAWTLVVSLNRIAFGAHFLSDVILSWCLTLLVILAMRLLILQRPPAGASARIDAWFASLPGRILARILALVRR